MCVLSSSFAIIVLISASFIRVRLRNLLLYCHRMLRNTLKCLVLFSHFNTLADASAITAPVLPVNMVVSPVLVSHLSFVCAVIKHRSTILLCTNERLLWIFAVFTFTRNWLPSLSGQVDRTVFFPVTD